MTKLSNRAAIKSFTTNKLDFAMRKAIPRIDTSPSQSRFGHNRRKHERHQTNINATAHCHGRHQSVVIRNVSCGGLMMANAFGLAVGDLVTITLLNGSAYHGAVAWSVSPYTGLKFEHRLGPDDILLSE